MKRSQKRHVARRRLKRARKDAILRGLVRVARLAGRGDDDD